MENPGGFPTDPDYYEPPRGASAAPTTAHGGALRRRRFSFLQYYDKTPQNYDKNTYKNAKKHSFGQEKSHF